MPRRAKSRARLPKAELALRAQSLRVDQVAGKITAREAAASLGVSRAQYYELLKHPISLEDQGVVIFPEPKLFEDLSPEAQAMLASNADAFKVFYETFSGLPLPGHAYDWIEAFLSWDMLLLNCPPRHAKSKIFSVWLPLWLVCRDRNCQILIISQTDKLAKKFAMEIAWHMENNQKLLRTFGTFRPSWQEAPWRPLQGELLVEGRSRAVEMGDLTIQVRGAGQQILGLEADYIICDDIVGEKAQFSEADREHLSEFYHGPVISRQSPKARVVVVGQRIHERDLYGELALETVPFTEDAEGKELPMYHHLNFPAILDWEERLVLWPEQWPFELLMRRYGQMRRKGKTHIFYAMYQQDPIPPSERLIQEEWIIGDATHPGCRDEFRLLGQGWSPGERVEGEGDAYTVRVMSIDPSPTKMAAIMVADVLNEREFFECGIIDIIRKPMTLRQMVPEIKRLYDTYRPQWIIFERSAAQRWALEDVEFDTWYRKVNARVIAHDTGRNKQDPEWGLQSLASDFERGRIRLPWADAAGRNQSQLLVEEAKSWPQGEYDDVLMSLWFMKVNLKRITYLVPPNKAKRRTAGWGLGRGGWAGSFGRNA